MPKFILEINLGNDGMSDGDIADVLYDVFLELSGACGDGKIRDINGNVIGKYGVV